MLIRGSVSTGFFSEALRTLPVSFAFSQRNGEKPRPFLLDERRHPLGFFNRGRFDLMLALDLQEVAADKYGRSGHLDQLEKRICVVGPCNGFAGALAGQESGTAGQLRALVCLTSTNRSRGYS
jgi:hypothetical protein